MSSTDDNTQETLKITTTALKYLYQYLVRLNYYRLEKKGRENMGILEKRSPSKVKVADIHRDDINRFLDKAKEYNIKCFEIIELENTDTHNLKYSIDDEYKIVEIFKEIQISKEREFKDVDFEKVKEDLKRYTGKNINEEDYKKAVKNLKKGSEGQKDKNADKTLGEVREEVESKVKEELNKANGDKNKLKNRGYIER